MMKTTMQRVHEFLVDLRALGVLDDASGLSDLTHPDEINSLCEAVAAEATKEPVAFRRYEHGDETVYATSAVERFTALIASEADCPQSFTPYRLRLRVEKRFQAGGTAFTLHAGAIVTAKQVDRAVGKVLLDFGDYLCDWVSQITVSSYFDRVDDDE